MRAVLFAAMLVFAGFTVACSGAGNTARNKEPVKKTYSRVEFRELLMGKTPDEVIATVGKPESTSDSGTSQYWYYHEATKDPVTGNVDRSVQVVFDQGRVTSVNY